jgi:hypothetical protein
MLLLVGAYPMLHETSAAEIDDLFRSGRLACGVTVCCFAAATTR